MEWGELFWELRWSLALLLVVGISLIVLSCFGNSGKEEE